MHESRYSLKLLAAAFGALLGSTCEAAPTWYVEAQGTATAIVQTVAPDGSVTTVGTGGVFNQNDAFYQQPVYQDSTSAAQRGNLNPNPPPNQPIRNGLQAADSSTSATATLGALHALAGADTTVSDYYPIQTQASQGSRTPRGSIS